MSTTTAEEQCCEGTFHLTKWSGHEYFASWVRNLKFAGIDESTGMPWYKNDEVTIAWNSWHGEPERCATRQGSKSKLRTIRLFELMFESL